jgi:hypothetical protein
LITHRHPDFPNVLGPVWAPNTHETQRWCLLLASAGMTADPTRLAIEPPPEPHGGHIMMHPGVRAPTRQWPIGRFAAVAAYLREAGHRVVLTGTAAEVPHVREVAERAGLRKPHLRVTFRCVSWPPRSPVRRCWSAATISTLRIPGLMGANLYVS